jgi:quercetin dioxygenase-like cupin family protein
MLPLVCLGGLVRGAPETVGGVLPTEKGKERMPRFALKDRLPLEGTAREEELYASRHLKLTLHAIDSGQRSREAARKGWTLVCALSGSVRVAVRGEDTPLEPGDAFAAAPGGTVAIAAPEAAHVVELEAPGPLADEFPSASKAAPQVTRASALAPFSPERFVKHPVLDSSEVRCDYLLMEAGQSLPPHTLPCDVALLVKEGQISVTMGSEEEEASPGDLVVVRAGETRGIRALARSIVLQAVSPRPGPEMRREVAELVAPEPLRDDD